MLIKMVKFEVITFDLPRSTSFYLPVANINDMQDGLPERLHFPDFFVSVSRYLFESIKMYFETQYIKYETGGPAN